MNRPQVKTAVKWLVAITTATLLAASPTRVGSHDVAIGFPFTFHSRLEIITLGDQPHSFSLVLFLLDIGIVLAAILGLAVALSRLNSQKTKT